MYEEAGNEKSNLHAEEAFSEKLESMSLDPCLSKLIQKYHGVFGALPPPLSCRKLVQMDLKIEPEFEGSVVRRGPYPAPQAQIDQIECQIRECIDACLVEEYKHGVHPCHCSPCFLVAKPGSTAMRLVVDYGEVNKRTQRKLREYLQYGEHARETRLVSIEDQDGQGQCILAGG